MTTPTTHPEAAELLANTDSPSMANPSAEPDTRNLAVPSAEPKTVTVGRWLQPSKQALTANDMKAFTPLAAGLQRKKAVGDLKT